MNSFGRNFRVTIFGESHGEALGVVMDGVTPGMALSVGDFVGDLARRQNGDAVADAGDPGGTGPQGRAMGTTPRRESDTPEIVSGVFEGHTTGAPLTILFRNENTRSGDYARLANHPRPSHADWVAAQKFRGVDGNPYNDPRGGGHFSGRVTLGLVAAGVVAKKMVGSGHGGSGVHISSEIIEIGGSRDRANFENIIAEAVKEGDSVGGVIECRAAGVPVGLGEPFFDSVESVVSHLMFAIPGVKGVEFGSGFEGARLRGSENNDPIIDDSGTTATNNAGGINGGITNGNQIVVRIAVKPTASIAHPQETYNFATGRVDTLEIGGRHDTCIALRAAVVAESALAIALADLALTYLK